jgi:hypothetical protein
MLRQERFELPASWLVGQVLVLGLGFLALK